MIRDSSPSLPHESAEFSWLVPPTTADYHLWAEYGQLSQTHSGFCIIFRTTDWRGGPDHTHNTPSQSKGLYGGSFLMPVWIQGGLLVPNFPIRELPFIQHLFGVLKCSLSSVSLTSSTNSSPSGGRTDACQTGDQLLTPYMNALTLRKPLVPVLQTLHSRLTFHFLKCCHPQFSLMQ